MKSTATRIVQRLQQTGHTAYFAGGCVRDAFLGLEAKDIDIATSAEPKEVMRLFPNSRAVGAHFGVILVQESGDDFEIATFRADGEYLDGRRPEAVVFTTPEKDAQRRDFTINGMFYDPCAETYIDFVDGQSDLKAGILRAIGNPTIRFREDYLRMLRAIRFAARFEYTIEAKTWKALCEQSVEIRGISEERIRDEFSAILLSPNRVAGFDLLVDSGLMVQIVPEVLDLKGCEQPPQFHPEGDVFEHTRIMLDLLPDEVSLPLVLSVLFHDIGKPPTFTHEEGDRIRFNGHDRVGAEMTERILRELKYPNDIIDATVEAVANHMVFKDVQKMRLAKLKRFMARPHFEDEMELHRVDCRSSHGHLDNYEFLKVKEEAFSNEPLIPPPLVNGQDLIDFGLTPGPAFKKILTQVQNQQLEGSLVNRGDALDWVKKEVIEKGSIG